MDETLQKVIENHAYTVSTRESKAVKALFSGDPKICLMEIVSISPTEGRSLMRVIAKGRIERRERRLRSHLARESKKTSGS
jgi:hypothetical protein